jgi:hypothetical protein
MGDDKVGVEGMAVGNDHQSLADAYSLPGSVR